jgi:hypothetical protein
MGAYTLPRETFNLLVEALGEKKKAEIFAKAIESAINDIQKQATEEIVEKKEIIKIEVKDELKNELVTREIFEERFKSLEREINERFKVVDEKFKSLNYKLNLFMAIALIALTFANPAFVALLEKLFF